MFSVKKRPAPDVTLSVSRNGSVTVRVSDYKTDMAANDVPAYVGECYQELKTTLEAAIASVEGSKKGHTMVIMSADFRL